MGRGFCKIKTLKYVSTRGQAPTLPFDEVLLTGLARDGGLYLPEIWPRFSNADLKHLSKLPYTELAIQIMTPFIGNVISHDDFSSMVEDTYRNFQHPSVAPLKLLDHNQWILELFHGPTLAFKDYPLQLVGRLFAHVLKKKGQKATIVGATSGDTGSAAIEACRDKNLIEVFMLHPAGRVSDVQRRQMTTVQSANIHNIALEGTFDDCQDMVKSLFSDKVFRKKHHLSTVNSINWARILAQAVYYFWSALALGAPYRKVIFSVPTGNFGNVFAGYAARRMGLQIEKFIVASNANDILTRFFETGQMSVTEVIPTLSPSMDIQISSNFERLLYEYYKQDGKAVAKVMEQFRRKGSVSFGKGRWKAISRLFEGQRVEDNAIKDAIFKVYQETGEILDPHTAVGVVASQKALTNKNNLVISLATAHPAKFPDAIQEATGIRPALPPHLNDLFQRKESYLTLPNDFESVREFIATTLENGSKA